METKSDHLSLKNPFLIQKIREFLNNQGNQQKKWQKRNDEHTYVPWLEQGRKSPGWPLMRMVSEMLGGAPVIMDCLITEMGSLLHHSAAHTQTHTSENKAHRDDQSKPIDQT
jgi:hypothetical protein